MIFNGRIFSKEETKAQKMERATEASANSINHQMKEEYTLRDKYYPYVESFSQKQSIFYYVILQNMKISIVQF